jgi:energy-coupling factor transporter ATP-binding protein EcfA2
MRRPSLLVLDEPTAGLAPQRAHELLFEHVTRLAGTGIAILLVEQHTQDALAVAQWAYVMASGQVQLAGPAAGIAERPDLGDIFLGRSTNPAITSSDGSGLSVSPAGQPYQSAAIRADRRAATPARADGRNKPSVIR